MQEITGCSSVEIHALTGLLLSGPGTGVPLPWAILRPADASEVRRRHPASTGPFGSFGLLPPAVFCQRSGPGPRPKPEERCLGGGARGGGLWATLFWRRRTRPCPAQTCSGACGSCARRKPSPVKKTAQDQRVKRASKPSKLLVQ